MKLLIAFIVLASSAVGQQDVPAAFTVDEDGLWQWAEFRAHTCSACKDEAEPPPCRLCRNKKPDSCILCLARKAEELPCMECGGRKKITRDPITHPPCRQCWARGHATCAFCSGSGFMRSTGGSVKGDTCPCCKKKGHMRCPLCKGKRHVAIPEIGGGDFREAPRKPIETRLKLLERAYDLVWQIEDSTLKGRVKSYVARAKKMKSTVSQAPRQADRLRVLVSKTKKFENHTGYDDLSEQVYSQFAEALMQLIEAETHSLRLALRRLDQNESAKKAREAK